MGLKAACGSCGKTYNVGDENAGKRFKCKACGGVIAGIKMLIIAFAESAFCGLMYLFVPFYGLYYLITRWEQTKEPFGAAIGGWVIVMATAFCANMAKGG